jgi:hypothetical protein
VHKQKKHRRLSTKRHISLQNMIKIQMKQTEIFMLFLLNQF